MPLIHNEPLALRGDAVQGRWSECIDKPRIRRLYFRPTHKALRLFHNPPLPGWEREGLSAVALAKAEVRVKKALADLAPSGGMSIAASTGHAEAGRRGCV
jgi:hypothetical protein